MLRLSGVGFQRTDRHPGGVLPLLSGAIAAPRRPRTTQGAARDWSDQRPGGRLVWRGAGAGVQGIGRRAERGAPDGEPHTRPRSPSAASTSALLALAFRFGLSPSPPSAASPQRRKPPRRAPTPTNRRLYVTVDAFVACTTAVNRALRTGKDVKTNTHTRV